MPAWLTAVEHRLRWLARRRRGRRSMQRRLARAVLALSQDSAASLARFQQACLMRLEQAVAERRGFDDARAELEHRLALARAALAGDDQAWRALERREGEAHLDGDAFWAGRVPGRVVWLGHMAASVPEEVRGAATMLVNDLSTLGRDAVIGALETAAGY